MFHLLQEWITALTNFNAALVYLLLFTIIFAETGLMIGFFLPGDSLLFFVGFLSSQIPNLNIWVMAPLLFIAAVIGDSVGYTFGKKVGKRLFEKDESRFFKKDHLLKAERFYEKHGGKTIILARFLPAIRTFAPIVAGIGNMKYSTFLFYNVVGGFLWTFGLLFAGYYLGRKIPSEKMELYLIIIIFGIIVVSVFPAAYSAFKTPKQREEAVASLRLYIKALFEKKK